MQALHEVSKPNAKDVLHGLGDTVSTLSGIFGTTSSKWQMCNWS